MYLFVCLTALFALAASSCENTPDLETLKQRFCQADLAFYGVTIGGSSGISFDPRTQQQFEQFSWVFQVAGYLKISNARYIRDRITVSRSFSTDSPCDITAFSNSGNQHVIFAEEMPFGGLRVDPCYYNPDLGCLPREFMESYSNPNFCNDL